MKGFNLVFLLVWLQVLAVQANTVVAVTGNSGNGNLDPFSFYEIDTVSGESTLKGDTGTVVPNQLAYDESTDHYYFMDHTGSNFYGHDVSTGTNTNFLIGDLTLYGMPAGKTGSGGGDFYNGAYYYTPETGSNQIYSITFQNDGTEISSFAPITPTGLSAHSDLDDGTSFAGLGDFGDFAVDSETGILYGSSRLSHTSKGGEYYAFWSIDLAHLDQPMVMIDDNAPSVYQLAFDEENNLFANVWGSGGDLIEIDKTDGSQLGHTQILIGGANASGDFYDMASTGTRQGVEVVPEPASVTFLMSALALLFQRRRRS
ncbi:MAG: hypothetical protein KJO21_04290 [Verrucomicrobiae bacterium]|nr:hypothetical protein [Verrucomicrobiae bacterium]NNJ42712.1 hypothetical protein [Akkermansiaceae bacterium]